MSDVLVYKTYGGLPWTPKFVDEINKAVCLGCGRCVKLCVQECLSLESFEDDEGTERHVAKIANKDQCIGCQSCGKICVRRAYTFKAKSA
ncbi:4Fe-4S dicluster domain-containing protein [Desulfosporosinus shakirovi]|uniref:4Fe-4S dicluster domain-containing protein n=1 Tax=Desulfosporosinus shakirovi TaxID=2885154 RepID=UPI001E3432C6|nr:4Fe-4S dicluster domain-containing protein [Desulfosporosinus sp. SRJS8]MCB8814250.1 4Fe-4S dicluster domain-containing protein [Desulfosporosinus sp. SRJS8]